MNDPVQEVVRRATGARSARHGGRMHELWAGWGHLDRWILEGSRFSSVVVKQIRVPQPGGHLPAWDSDLSHTRKVRSYAVERAFYQEWLPALPRTVRFARPLLLRRDLFVLEDLDEAGFAGRAGGRGSLPDEQVTLCLGWLAAFHAAFLGRDPVGLWPTGTYWHLDTRPDELARMADGPLKRSARALDRALGEARFRTIVHGDAKVANFCFAEHGVAAVDFQYVGGGCGLSDVAYFLVSALRPRRLALRGDDWLDVYFEQLGDALDDPGLARQVEAAWRPLWPVAWADYQRFLAGWAPDRLTTSGYAHEQAMAGCARVGE